MTEIRVSSRIRQESRALADEELLLLAVQGYSVRPGQADAMPRGKGPDYAGTSTDRSFDQIAMVLPMHRHPLVDSPEDFRKRHHSTGIAADHALRL